MTGRHSVLQVAKHYVPTVYKLLSCCHHLRDVTVFLVQNFSYSFEVQIYLHLSVNKIRILAASGPSAFWPLNEIAKVRT